MLVLHRNSGESVVIELGGELVRVTVWLEGWHHGRVKLGIDAPKHIVVDRLEVHEAKERAARREKGAGCG